ncbi:DUF802 domain-containing protein [Paraburkholderia silviterrae]|uniref:DUF802 domain-containing protein n=1 Tax=Paraburkholderia silviterrae TaxID=2528715 RepID=A0A4R5M2B1_9BURK|nr:DUF802 domain-containing protein [Paraburkholderia silviterrae]TDG19634.1 DUF802 domain-containing protein [Paraburkholderia silviterrae]
MSRLRIDLVVFLAGLAAVCWIAAGYAGSNPLALAVTVLIGACYVAGAFELYRYNQATATLTRAVGATPRPAASLGAWLDPLHPSLRSAVRARVEGERVALPGPSLTPYLVGLLVLLGMLGTLLGMVTTLRGTGVALDGATDLDGIRAALAGPIRGLGFAFGTSIAGVASSAMLGLLSALCRRERIEAAQRLDAQIGTTLRPFSHAHQRETSFALMQRQAEAMPQLVERLGAMMTAIERQGAALGERQLASQQAFLDSAEAAYARLASSVGESLKASAAESARAAGAAFAPVVEATMAGLARESAALHGTLTQAVERQLDGLASGFEANTTRVAGIWNEALADQRRSGEALARDLQGALERFTATFEARSANLVQDVDARLAASASGVSQAWQEALARQERAGEKLASDNQQALSSAAATFEQHSAALLRAVSDAQANLQTQLVARDEARLATWSETLGAMGTTLRDEWRTTSAQAAEHQQAVCATLAQTAEAIAAQTETHANGMLAEISRAAVSATAAWQTASTQAAERQQAVCETLAKTASDIAAHAGTHTNSTIAEITRVAEASSAAWQAASTQAAERQQIICDALSKTANDIGTQTAAHASGTIAEISRAAEVNAAAWQAASTQAAERQQTICDALAKTANDISAQTEAHASGTIAEIARAAQANASAWQAASAQAAERQQAICDALAKTANDIAAQTEAHASGTITEIARAAEANATAWQAASAQAAERQQIICDALAKTANDIATQTEAHASGTIAEIARAAEANATAWQAASTQAAERHQATCDALEKTANIIATQTEAHANGTIAEIARLVDAASEAPRVAAEVVAELRQKLSESMVQDTAMLEERSRLLSTVTTLLDAVNHASTEQRTAIDALVQTSAGLMERVGARFDSQVEAGAHTLEGAAAQVTGSAVEMASLGDAFGAAVQHFGESNDKLLTQLQRIETALDKSLSRSDDQLAYYVAQAKEVIDLSLLSQKQIVENLQRFSAQAGAEAA